MAKIFSAQRAFFAEREASVEGASFTLENE
jgi:hypothetical protein